MRHTLDAMDDGLPVDQAEFGLRVRRARQAQRLTLRELAGRIDVSLPRLAQAERGLKLSREDYVTLCRWMGDEGAAGVPARL